MTTYWISGGCGFLGQYIVQAVHAHDPQAELRVLIRTPRKTYLDLEKLDRVTWIRAELTRPETYRNALDGVDTVIHNAAMVSFNPAARQQIFDSNVIGTRHLAQAAGEAGCRDFIFISSISAVQFRPAILADETCIPDLEAKQKNDMYGYTKRLSEIELQGMIDRLRVIILNPSVILGPGSERIEAVIRMVRRFPVIPMLDYVNAFVDVRDVADAVTRAFTNGRSGERYIVSAHNVRMAEFTRLVVKHLGNKSRVLPISPTGVKALDGMAAILNGLQVFPGVRRPSELNVDKPCSAEKIKTDMGWVPKIPLEQSIADSVSRFRDESQTRHP